MNLAGVLRAWRLHKELGVRDAAKMIGVSSATFSRIERGESMDGGTLAKILLWLIREEN